MMQQVEYVRDCPRTKPGEGHLPRSRMPSRYGSPLGIATGEPFIAGRKAALVLRLRRIAPCAPTAMISTPGLPQSAERREAPVSATVQTLPSQCWSAPAAVHVATPS